MKGLLVYIITLLLVIIFYTDVSSLIYKYGSSNVYTKLNKEFYLYSIDTSGISIAKVDVNSVDIPNRTVTNQYNKIIKDGRLEGSTIPIEGFIGTGGHYSAAGLNIEENRLCLKFLSDQKTCVPTHGQLPIPMVEDFTSDLKDELSVYYSDTGNFAVYEIDQNSNRLTFIKQFNFPANGFPTTFFKNNKNYIGVWVETNNPMLYFVGYLDAEYLMESLQFGLEGDIPTPLDILCEGKSSFGVYRRANQTWYFLDHEPFKVGTQNGIPIKFDFDRDGCPEISMYDRKIKNNLTILPSSINLKNLHIFPNGNGLVYNSRLDSSEYRPLAYWNYERYKRYKSFNQS